VLANGRNNTRTSGILRAFVTKDHGKAINMRVKKPSVNAELIIVMAGYFLISAKG
jgi:hypothetical protein